MELGWIKVALSAAKCRAKSREKLVDDPFLKGRNRIDVLRSEGLGHRYPLSDV
jgi:hypothetical protein